MSMHKGPTQQASTVAEDKDFAKPPKPQPKNIWEGKYMPSILRGSKAHNAKLDKAKKEKEAQAKREAKAKYVIKTEAPRTTEQIKENSDILAKVTSVVAAIQENSAEMEKALTSFNASALRTDEVLLDSPKRSPKKTPLILSPFSKAKVKARAVGLVLKEELRDTYNNCGTQEDYDTLLQRIDTTAKFNAQWKAKRK